jgi:hypothetical protein
MKPTWKSLGNGTYRINTMTLETMHQVAAALTKRGLPTTTEYPGYLQTETAHDTFVSGDASGVVAVSILEADGWNENELAVSELTHESEDVGAITTFLEAAIREALDDDAEPEETEDSEPDEPQEDDIVTSDGRNFYQSGKRVLSIGPDDDRDEELKAYMERAQYWPNCWSISDHGNAHLIHFESKEN